MPGEEEAERALAAAEACYAAFDVEGVVAHLSAAVRGFTAAGATRDAAMTCARLGDALANAMGNLTAGRAWYARAWRLIESEPPAAGYEARALAAA